MNIGIFGGTFNPPHVGHLIVADRVREELGLARVLFVPSAISPHKQHLHSIDPDYRMEMVQLAVHGQQFFEPSDIEVRRGGVSYTVDTLECVKKTFPDAVLYLLIGMDNLLEFDSWKFPERIIELARITVMTRPGFQHDADFKGRGKGFVFCKVPEIGISSSEIRERVKHGKTIRYLVPRSIESYIYYRKLYL
jgi:nicotinate-nucleotide adenylyltransferase